MNTYLANLIDERIPVLSDRERGVNEELNLFGRSTVGDPNRGAGQLGLPQHRVQAGTYRNSDGDLEHGINLNAQSFNLRRNLGVGGTQVGVRADGPNANAQITANRNSAQVGAQLTLGSVEAHLGDEDDDHLLRIGLSQGMGAGGRVHYGDRDGDGFRSYGLGLDVGPISVDVRGENPHSDFSAIIAADQEQHGAPEARPATPEARRIHAHRERLRRERAERARAQAAAAPANDPMNVDPLAEARRADALRQRAATASTPRYDMNAHFRPLTAGETYGQDINVADLL